MKTKVDIIAGFLGAGKTTFIKKMVTQLYNNEKVVVLENEFGKINIDGDTLKNSGITVKEIRAGCICCTSSSDFVSSISEIIEELNPERIIIEPTGVAKLSELLMACKNIANNDLFVINNIISILDASKFEFRKSCSKIFIDDQIKYSKTIVFSKNKNIPISKLEEIYLYIKTINENVKIADFNWDYVNGEELIYSIENNEMSTSYIDGIEKDKNKINMSAFSSIEFEPTNNFDIKDIEPILECIKNEDVYGTILRGKGILKNNNKDKYKFDYVQGDLNFTPYFGNEGEVICIIGLNLDRNKIFRLLS